MQVAALIEGINAYEGGIVMVSHDARLITATECDLWVCDGNGSLHEFSQGFYHYKRQILKEAARQTAAMKAAAERKIEEGRESRCKKLQVLRSSRCQPMSAFPNTDCKEINEENLRRADVLKMFQKRKSGSAPVQQPG